MITLTKQDLPEVVVANAADIEDIGHAVADSRDGDSALRIEIIGQEINTAAAPCTTDNYVRGCDCPSCDSFGAINLIYWMTETAPCDSHA